MHIKGQSYIPLPNNIIFSRQWRVKVAGKETIDAFFEFFFYFNRLNLTDLELAFLFPFIITTNRKSFDEY